MVISERIKNQYFAGDNEQGFIRIAQTNAPVKPKRNGLPWTTDEHDRFLSALEAYPSGPWKIIASLVGTRTTRQTMTHAQKYREKIARMKRATKEHSAVTLVVRPPLRYFGDILPPPRSMLEIYSPASPSMFPAPHHQQHPLALPSMHDLIGSTSSVASPGAGIRADLPASTAATCNGDFSSTNATVLPHVDVDHGVLRWFSDTYEPIEINDDAWYDTSLARDSSVDDAESTTRTMW